MEIVIPNKKLKASLEDDDVCLRRYGKVMAKLIRLRVDALSAAECLYDFWPPNSKPERVHQLHGDWSGHFSMDLHHPYRLIFRSLSPPTAAKDDAREAWRAIKTIEITSIEDTHG